MDINAIPVGGNVPNNVNVIIEVPTGGEPVKYEFDKKSGALFVDRILHTPMRYPANYGFIPRTFAKDRDPLDVLVLCSEELEPLSMVKCYPVGVIRMIDEEQEDHKIIAIPFEDPNWNYFHEMSELPPHLSQEVEHFFQVYKTLEHKETTGFEVLGRKEALRIIEESIVSYQEIFGDGQKTCK